MAPGTEPATGHCGHCGAELAGGRFCAGCGAPVPGRGGDAAPGLEDWRTDTAERPAAADRPVTHPPAATVPQPARFPLFADEPAEPSGEVGDGTTREVAPVPAPATDPGPGHQPSHREPHRVAWLPWVVGLLALALVGGLGTFLLLAGGDDPSTASDPAPTEREPRERPREKDAEPTEETSSTPEPAPAGMTDLARFAGIEAPEPAPPSQDNSGNVVRYDAAQMVDGVPETTWRTPGDATGATITFTFDEPTVLSQVGLINGYAKVGQDAKGPLDWYHGNRRVTKVSWTFDDGTVLDQRLDDTTVMQTRRVRQVETTTVALRLVRVSAPGTGRASRDNTAISDVQLVGHTA